MAKRRELNVFSLSFLDIMSCGFGAVILIFIVINHSTETTTQEVNVQLLAEVKRLEEDIKDETDYLVVLRNTVQETENDVITTEGVILEILERIKQLELEITAMLEDSSSRVDSIEALKVELKKLEEEAASLEGSVAADEASGSSLRSFIGEGDRQYLTGLKVGGENIVVLLDASASMLDRRIVDITRRRFSSDAVKMASPKWQRAVKTVDWITANLPKNVSFQLYTFNTKVTSAIPERQNEWLNTMSREDMDRVVEHVSTTIPDGGTSLHHAFAQAAALDPEPDNIFLLVDGLPTQDMDPPKRTVVTSRERMSFFAESLQLLPNATPVNVILFPMEGDPMAAPSFWRLAQMTAGSFLSPPDDWP